MKRTNFYYPAQMLAALKALSKLDGLSVSEHIRRAVQAYIDAKEKK